MNGILNIVATPIGNLDEITCRAVEILKNSDIILCEDTAHSGVLLARYGIKTKKISYHKFNETARLSEVLELLKKGNKVALIADAGMPCISDPGAKLVKVCREEGLPVTVVSGASALINAFALTGFTPPFTFIGFLPEKNRDKTVAVEPYKNLNSALIFYCAPHDLVRTLDFLYSALGARKAVLCRELTKLHEETVDFVLGAELNITLKGEFVIVVEGSQTTPAAAFADTSIEEHLLRYIQDGISKKDAVKRVATERGLPRNEVYQAALGIKAASIKHKQTH